MSFLHGKLDETRAELKSGSISKPAVQEKLIYLSSKRKSIILTVLIPS